MQKRKAVEKYQADQSMLVERKDTEKARDMSCWEIIKKLRKEKSARHIPFICLSSRVLSDEIKGKEEGVILITKPFENKRLIETIQAIHSSF